MKLLISLLAAASIVSAQGLSCDGINVKIVAFTGGKWSMNAQGIWIASDGTVLGKAVYRDVNAVNFNNYRIDMKGLKVVAPGSTQTITACWNESSDAVNANRCSDGFNAKDFTFGTDRWMKTSGGDWVSANSVNMGLEVGRDVWSVFFANYQLDLYWGKAYKTTPTKTEIGTITACSSVINTSHPMMRCGTAWNVNSVTFMGFKWTKNSAGDWIRSDGTNMGKETARDMFTIYFTNWNINLWSGKLQQNGASGFTDVANVLDCSVTF